MDGYMFYRLYKKKFYGSAIGLWIIAGPLMVLFNFITFISVPMMFLVLAYLNIDKMKRATLYLGLGICCYTYIAIPALFFFVYYIKKEKWNGLKSIIIGLIPALIIIGPFLAWDPMTFVSDLFLSQGYVNE